jgi:hypothetical protein
VQGDAAKKPQITLPNPQGTGGVTGEQGSQTRVNTFTTTYVVENPTPQQMITLGTETLTFQPGVTSVGTPLGGTLPLPAQPTSSTTP